MSEPRARVDAGGASIGASLAGAPTAESAPSFAAIFRRILEHRWRSSPVTATIDGVAGHDHELDSFAPRTLEAQLAETAGLARLLAELPDDALTADERLDRAQVLGTLEADLHDWHHVRTWTWNPAIYPETAIYACYLLAVRESRPLEERMRALAARLSEIPRLLAEGLANLDGPARVLSENAIETCAGARELFGTTLPAVAAATAPAIRDRVAAGSADATAALDAYAARLREQLDAGGAVRNAAIGEAAFTLRFEKAHGLAITTDALLELAARVRRETEERLRQVAARIDPHRSWRELWREIGSDHPPAEAVLDAYRGEVARVRRFVAERGLVAIADEDLAVVATPEFERPLIPIAAYLPPAPLEPAGRGLFYVTPLPDGLEGEAREAWLAHHAWPNITQLVVHEAFPGHHLQLARAKRCGSRARALYGTPLLCEGWALYCEQLMVEEGLSEDPRVELTQLRDALFRTWRVDVDVRLHRGEWTVEESTERLVDAVGLDPATARAEVRRYAAWPTQASTYLVGRELLLDLRARVRERAGAGFELARFHDHLLSFGSLSPALTRRALLGEVPFP